MSISREAMICAAAEAFDQLHGDVMGRLLPKLANTMHGRDMSFSQLGAIIGIFIQGPKTISQIAERADITHNAASRMVDRLVKAGFMTRTEDPLDRRQKVVDLTPAGKAIPPEWRAATINAYADILTQVPEELLLQLFGLIRQVQASLPPRPEAFGDRRDTLPPPQSPSSSR